jgi:hypothetical protein
MRKEEWKLVDSVQCQRPCTSFHVVVGTMEGPSAEAADRISEELVTELNVLHRDLAELCAKGLASQRRYA